MTPKNPAKKEKTMKNETAVTGLPTESAPRGMKHAWYSRLQEKATGLIITWKRTNGEHVKLTEVSDSAETGIKWQDVRYLGLVEEFVISVKPGQQR